MTLTNDELFAKVAAAHTFNDQQDLMKELYENYCEDIVPFEKEGVEYGRLFMTGFNTVEGDFISMGYDKQFGFYSMYFSGIPCDDRIPLILLNRKKEFMMTKYETLYNPLTGATEERIGYVWESDSGDVIRGYNLNHWLGYTKNWKMVFKGPLSEWDSRVEA